MVNSPQWVMYGEELYKVNKQIGDMLYLIPNTIRYRTGGWTDPRVGIVRPVDRSYEDYVLAYIEQCQPITPEVADIMRNV